MVAKKNARRAKKSEGEMRAVLQFFEEKVLAAARPEGEELIAEGGAFKRDLLVGPFSPTNDVDYCDPDAGGHDD